MIKGSFIWLVVWSIFYFPIYWVANHPNWLIFFRGVAQPPTSLCVDTLPNSGRQKMFHKLIEHRGCWNAYLPASDKGHVQLLWRVAGNCVDLWRKKHRDQPTQQQPSGARGESRSFRSRIYGWNFWFVGELSHENNQNNPKIVACCDPRHTSLPGVHNQPSLSVGALCSWMIMWNADDVPPPRKKKRSNFW